MHKESYDLMKYFVEKYVDKNKKLEILDVGSYDVNGSYRDLFSNENWNYTGLDMCAGPNVDIVTKSEYDFGIDKEYDVVISGNCLEHVEAPWKWIKEVEKSTKKDGIICIITPFSVGEHKYPLDCWRILPDGYRYLLEKESTFKILETRINILPEKHHFFEYRPRLNWFLKIIPENIKKMISFKPVQDTIVIALKK